MGVGPNSINLTRLPVEVNLRMTLDSVPENGLTDTGNKLPKYAIIREWLTEQILEGAFLPGHRLPTENELGDRFGVSRVTVRHALGEMRRAGMIESRQGQGYFVRKFRADLDLRRLQGLQESLNATGAKSSARLLDRETIVAHGDVRKQLGLSTGSQILRVRRIRLINAAPVCHEARHFPAKIVDDVTDGELQMGDICTFLEIRLGVPIAYGDVVMEMVNAPVAILPTLEIAAGTMVVRTEQTCFDVNRKPVEFCIRHAIAGAFRYKTRLGRE